MMIRKQLYLAPEQDRKLKALAVRRGSTEAEVMREALDRLPDPSGDPVAQLEFAGLLAPPAEDIDAPVGAELRALEADLDAWLAARAEPLELTEVVLDERAGREA
jgi:hypothetical protein